MTTQYHLPTSGAKLEVHLIAGRHLKIADVTGKSDPYVIFKCGDVEAKSKIKPNTLNPEWNEKIHLELKNSKPEYLEILVLDHDAIGKDDPLGALVLPLNDLYVTTNIRGALCRINTERRIQSLEKQRWIKLQGVETGEIFIGLTAINFVASLTNFLILDSPLPSIDDSFSPGYPSGTFAGYDPKTLDISNHIPPAYAPKGYLIQNGSLVKKDKKKQKA